MSASQPTVSSRSLTKEDEKLLSTLFADQQSGPRPSTQLHGSDSRALLISEEDIAKERHTLEGHGSDGKIRDNKFAFSPAVIDKLLNPKNLAVFAAVGGLSGLEIGLRTNRHSGLSSNEDVLSDHVSFKDVEARLAGRDVSLDAVSPITIRTASRMSLASIKRATGRFTDRTRVFKDNHLPSPKPKTFLHFVWATYNDKVLILLTVAAAVSLAIGLYQALGTPSTPENPPIEWVEGVAIIIAIIIIVLAGSINDYQKEGQFLRLDKKKQSRDVKVIRSGKSQQISIFDVLVGDVVLIEPGDVLPADGIFIDGYNVKCDESSVTGESDHVRKHPADEVFRAIQSHESPGHNMDPFIISGSKVVEGVGTFLVTATGVNSYHGKTLASLQVEHDVTPLQVRLEKLAKQITKVGVVLALIMFVVLFIRFLVNLKHNTDEPTAKDQSFQKGQIFLNDVLIISLTVLVIVVPEGLPLAVTLALAFAATRMIRDNNLVRRLKSCETMGNATAICSDKTGTLTQNKMKVVAGTIGAHLQFPQKAEPVALSTEPVEPLSREEKVNPGEVGDLFEPVERMSRGIKDLLEDSIAINSTAFEAEEHGKQIFIGSNTESALLQFARDHLGMGPAAIKRANATITQLVPFDAARKCMATVVRLAYGTHRMYVKGAPEVLLGKCTRIMEDTIHGVSDVPITTEHISALQNIVTSYASRSLRTIALLYRDFDKWPPDDARTVDKDSGEVAVDDVLKDLVFLAVVGIQDPLRDDVIEAVQACRRAGITVRMVTGDNVWTARAIARESGILLPDELVMEGSEFRALSESEAAEKIPHLRVLARSSSEDKRLLVTLLKNRGEVVAVTGDGTNDAPALAAADIGFSMGISGTEIAREAASIILMDDNFSSIVKAIMWGRAINDAVRKFLQVRFFSVLRFSYAHFSASFKSPSPLPV